MSGQTTFYDYGNLQMSQTPRHSVSTVSSRSTNEGTGLSFWDPTLSPTLSPNLGSPITTPSSFQPQKSEFTSTLLFKPPLQISFSKGSNLFKIKFGRLDVIKDAGGGLRCLEWSDPNKEESTFLHTFPNTRLPIPHLEQPFVSSQAPSFRVSFLEEQTAQTAGTLFQTKPSYSFERWEDCIRFQEAILSQTVVFTAGIAEAKSRGRGEECISQNLRVLKSRSGRQIIIFFANSQPKEKKKYISIPLDCIDQIDPGKKASRPVMLKLRADNDLLATLKNMRLQFLDDSDHMRFCSLLQQGCVRSL